MLGCHDFCGYYDWTFAYIRKHKGQAAVRDLWEDAIANESQAHYLEAGLKDGLTGLYNTWHTTGEDENCDWTFTLDESRNVLRWDMRQCPSKGFVLDNDLVADEDYCDHCLGWMAPLLKKAGFSVVEHEHNHKGQCWGHIANPDLPTQAPESFPDIRKDPRWQKGFVDRWSHNTKLPVLNGVSDSADSCDVLADWFTNISQLVVMGRGPCAEQAGQWLDDANPAQGVIVADPTYATQDVYQGRPSAVLMGDRPSDDMLDLCAKRFHATAPEDRPLLLGAFLPRAAWPAWEAHHLPRPIPILPLLLRNGLYQHRSNGPYPTTGTLMVLLATALGKEVIACGMDLYQPTRKSTRNLSHGQDESPVPLSAPHTFEVELACLRQAMTHAPGRVHIHGQASRWLV